MMIAAGVIFVFHEMVDLTANTPDFWNLSYVIIYPSCFLASLVLAISRLLNFVPNPAPIIPLAISVIGWAAMLIGAIMAMRHANLKLDIGTLTDEEVGSSPIFRHDLSICAMSLIGSSLYLVHAWLCYDCWCWDKRVKQKPMEAVDSAQSSTSNSEWDSDSETSSSHDSEANYPPEASALALPGTSDDRDYSRQRKSSRRKSKVLAKLKETPKTSPEQIDPLATLNDVLQSTVEVPQIRVEDEPVRLYCCCMDLGNMIKREYMKTEPVHEFQVVHVM